MVGSVGERVLSITLPHVDAWNAWFDDYGNTPEGFATLNARVTGAIADAGRESADVLRSACVLVVLDRGANERTRRDGVTPLQGTPDRIAAALRELAEAGAGEVICVMDPITEGSIRGFADVLAILDA
jgi:alkanesulfonate monooxygenase SsuD/methylene tetrahydromethanopterin reductase-like flavin-dependent oxidoreductase (luciferase family)